MFYCTGKRKEGFYNLISKNSGFCILEKAFCKLTLILPIDISFILVNFRHLTISYMLFMIEFRDREVLLFF